MTTLFVGMIDEPVIFRKNTEYAVIHHHRNYKLFQSLERAKKYADRLTKDYCANSIIKKDGTFIQGTGWR